MSRRQTFQGLARRSGLVMALVGGATLSAGPAEFVLPPSKSSKGSRPPRTCGPPCDRREPANPPFALRPYRRLCIWMTWKKLIGC